ncbi:MAG TPA: GNAT family N-acetyltransferase [Bryobacteraceae bacterium]|jgi:RimJ/RimL family protein N-acetyltransferase
MTEFTLKDGASVRVRPIRPEDDRTLIEVFSRSSPETVYQRFLAPLRELTPAMARTLASVDNEQRLAFIAETDAGPVGVVRYDATRDPAMAELGLVVVDEWQNRGLGRLLLREILRAAEEKGIHRFRAELLAENRRILHLLTDETEIEDWKIEAGVTALSLTLRHAA